MKHGSLFSGIGGFDLAAEWAGFENIFQVEIDSFCQKVLTKNFPNTDKYYDIKEFDGTKYRGLVNIISGGFPCQDISIAGINNGRKGLGGNKSSLFYQLVRIVSEVKPDYVVFENSPMVRNYLTEIHKSFKQINYVYTGKTFSARDYGFPHKRERYYGIAIPDTDSIRRDEIIFKNSIFEKIYKSKEVLRLQKANKTKFSRTLSSSLRSKAETKFVRNTDGISDKLDKDRIKSCGNAIIPQIAYEIFKVIKEIDNT